MRNLLVIINKFTKHSLLLDSFVSHYFIRKISNKKSHKALHATVPRVSHYASNILLFNVTIPVFFYSASNCPQV